MKQNYWEGKKSSWPLISLDAALRGRTHTACSGCMCRGSAFLKEGTSGKNSEGWPLGALGTACTKSYSRGKTNEESSVSGIQGAVMLARQGPERAHVQGCELDPTNLEKPDSASKASSRAGFEVFGS